MRIAIVNDMATSAMFLRQVVESVGGWRFAWEARDGKGAVTKCLVDRPDLILMDLNMPLMNGVEATRQIMQQAPCAILIVTAGVEENTAQVFEALGGGALDVVNMPQPGDDSIETLIRKIRTVDKLIGVRQGNGAAAKPVRRSRVSDGKAPLIAIGASTGGPAALKVILADLPADLPAAVVIVQHVDRQFAPGMAGWLNAGSPLPVRVAQEGESPAAGEVLLAGTNDHLVLTERQELTYTPHPEKAIYRPSVDELFASAALYWKGDVIAVLLSGMGRDGARGLLALSRLGNYTIAQDEESCAVYSMPKAAQELGAVCKQLPPAQIGGVIRSLVNGCGPVASSRMWRESCSSRGILNDS